MGHPRRIRADREILELDGRRAYRGGVVAELALAPEDVGAAGATVARAFHDDALTAHLYPDERERARLTPLMFEALVRYDCLFGVVDHLPGFVAVASWMCPGETVETPERLTAAGFDDLPPEVPLERLDEFFSSISWAHETSTSGPHWYLRLLGVDPEHQGTGLGSVLLEHGLRRADATGHPCYLETFEERNMPFYLRHGFDLVVDEATPTPGLRMWGFYRPAS